MAGSGSYTRCPSEAARSYPSLDAPRGEYAQLPAATIKESQDISSCPAVTSCIPFFAGRMRSIFLCSRMFTPLREASYSSIFCTLEACSDAGKRRPFSPSTKGTPIDSKNATVSSRPNRENTPLTHLGLRP